MNFINVYQDRHRAESYAALEYPGTYYLAFRDIPELIAQHMQRKGRDAERALDFGCGAGRSTRFLKALGFEVTGVDISAEMLEHARFSDPEGEYRLVGDGDLSSLEERKFDLILSAFTFDNIPSREHKLRLFGQLCHLLKGEGILINLVSSPEIYLREWASFSTRYFPENRTAGDGDPVKIIMTDVADRRPVVDIRCSDELYRELYREAGFELCERHSPLGTSDEPFDWKSETEAAPWSLYVLRRI